jgi:hypothetical protein
MTFSGGAHGPALIGVAMPINAVRSVRGRAAVRCAGGAASPALRSSWSLRSRCCG